MYTPAFAKPTYKRTKEKKKPPLFEMGYCMRCYWKHGLKRSCGLEKHHVWGGPNRPISEHYGAYFHLCNDFQPEACHKLVTDEKDQEFIKWLEEEAQRRFILKYGEQLYFEKFIGRSYL